MDQLPLEVLGLIARQTETVKDLCSFRSTCRALQSGSEGHFRSSCFTIRTVSIKSHELIKLTAISLSRFRTDVIHLRVDPNRDRVDDRAYDRSHSPASRRPVPLGEIELLQPKHAAACLASALHRFSRCDTVTIVDPCARALHIPRPISSGKPQMSSMPSWCHKKLQGTSFNIRAAVWVALVAVGSCGRQLDKINIEANVGFKQSDSPKSDSSLLPYIQPGVLHLKTPSLKLWLNTTVGDLAGNWRPTLKHLLSFCKVSDKLQLDFLHQAQLNLALVEHISSMGMKVVEIDNIECGPDWLLPLLKMQSLQELKVSRMTDTKSANPKAKWIGLFRVARLQDHLEKLVFKQCRHGRHLVDFGTSKSGEVSIPFSPREMFREGADIMIKHFEDCDRTCVVITPPRPALLNLLSSEIPESSDSSEG